MRFLLILFALTFTLPAHAQSVAVPAQSVATKCGAEWKEFKTTNGKPAKGEGREAWNAFYKACREKNAQGVTTQDKAALAAKIEAYRKGN